MKKRKYVLLILTFLTALLCSVGSSLWLVLDEKNVAPTPFVGFDIEIDGKMEGVEVTPSPTTPVATLPTIADMYYGQSDGLILSGGSVSIGSNTLAGVWKVDGVAPSAVVTTAEKFKVSSTAASTAVTVNLSFTPTNTLYKELQTTQTVNVKSVAYHGSNYYSTLKGAVDAANATASSAQNVVVIPDLGHEVIVNENVTVNSKVSLYVPFAEEEYTINDNRIKELASIRTYADSNATNVTNNRATLIKMQNGADLTVNSGAYLYLGGEYATIGVVGKYAEINLDEGSQITCSGTFYCYGYVKENATTAQNGNQTGNKTKYYNNDIGDIVGIDDGRLIQITSTGYMNTAIGIYDMKAVSDLTNLNSAGVFPFALFDFPNLQTYVEVVSGGKFSTTTHVVGKTSQLEQVVKEEAPIVTSDTSTPSIFHLTSGNVGVEYCPNNVNYTSTTATTRIYLNGTITQGSLKVEVSPYTIDTASSFIPISYKLNVFVNDGASYSTNGYKIKFLPGSSMKINSGGSVTIDTDTIFYESTYYSKILSYPSGKGDATLINNGTLTLTGEGKLGAYIQTEATDDSATVIFDCASDSSLTASAKEGENAEIVTRTSEGYFDDPTSEEGKGLYQFVAGSTITSSAEGTQCWTGPKYALRTLTLQVDKDNITNFTKDVFAYQIYTADDANGTNATEITSGVTNTVPTGGDIRELADGKYVKIAVSRHNSAETTINGEVLDPEQWYLVDSDLNVNIIPSEGILVKLTTNGDSGNGSTYFAVYESSTENGTFTRVNYGGSLTSLDTYIVKNWWFKIVYQDGNGTTSIKTITITAGPNTGSNFSSKAASKSSLTNPDTEEQRLTKLDTAAASAKAYQATESYTVNFKREGSICIVEGTMIMLADGTKKAVEDLQLGDMLLVYDHFNGTYAVRPFIMDVHATEEAKLYSVLNMTFSNGAVWRIAGHHTIFNATLNKYVTISESNVNEYIGHKFYYTNGTSSENVTMTSYYITEEVVKVFSPTTYEFANYFANGFLNAPPLPGTYTAGQMNYFDFDENMKYSEEEMQEDIEKYGLYTYEDFAEYLTEEVFNALPFKYFKISVGKGLMTWEDILALVSMV